MRLGTDNWQEIYAAIKKNKLRTALTAFGVFWGLFMLVIMLGAATGLRNGVMGHYNYINPRTSFFWGGQTAKPYKGFQKNRRIEFTNEDMEQLKIAVPEIELLSPRLEAPSWRDNNVITKGTVSKPFQIFGDYPDLNKVEQRKVIQGRFLNKTDIQFHRKVAVIGKKVYDTFFKPGEVAAGQKLEINGIFFTVIGVIQSYKTGWDGNRENESVHLPLTTLQRTYNYGQKVWWFGVASYGGISQENFEAKIKKFLMSKHRVHPEDNRAIDSDNVKKEFENIGGLFDGIDLLSWIVGIGTLLSGIIGISNIMIIVVKERTKEIGIKRAIGAQPMNIISGIIIESVFLSFIAGYIGLAIGVGLIELVASVLPQSSGESMFLNPEVDFGTCIRALFIVVVSGMVAGLVPAINAIKIKPIDALRDE